MQTIIDWDFGSYIFKRGPVSILTGGDPATILNLIKANRIMHFDYGQGLVDAPDIFASFVGCAERMGVEI